MGVYQTISDILLLQREQDIYLFSIFPVLFRAYKSTETSYFHKFFFFFFKLSVLLIFFSNLGLSGATACQLLEKSESMRVPGLHIKILCSKRNETNQIGKLKDWIVSMFTRFFLRSSHAHSLGNLLGKYDISFLYLIISEKNYAPKS